MQKETPLPGLPGGPPLTDDDESLRSDGRIAGVARGFDQMIMLGSGLSPLGQVRMCSMLIAAALQRTIVAGIVAAAKTGRPMDRRRRKRIIMAALDDIEKELNKRFLRGNDEVPLP